MNGIQYTLREWVDVPAGTDWLAAGELTRLSQFRFPKRRRDWLLGRWTAKQALLHIEGLPAAGLTRLEIASSASGAPKPYLDSEPLATGLSLSHSHGRALCVVSREVLELGCDLELVEPRRPSFVDTFFTDAERQRVEAADAAFRDRLVTMIWSAKESTLKALGTGLKADTRSIEVTPAGEPDPGGWYSADVTARDAGHFRCLWRMDGQFVLSVSATISAMSRTCTSPSSLATRTASSIMIMQKEQPTAMVSAPVSLA